MEKCPDHVLSKDESVMYHGGKKVLAFGGEIYAVDAMWLPQILKWLWICGLTNDLTTFFQNWSRRQKKNALYI